MHVPPGVEPFKRVALMLPLPLTLSDAPVPTTIAAVVFVPAVMALKAEDPPVGVQRELSGLMHTRRFVPLSTYRRPRPAAGAPGDVILAMSTKPLISAPHALDTNNKTEK